MRIAHEGWTLPSRTRSVDTRHLAAAVAVARTGSFTVAARELYMAQSTLSRQVAALERELGTSLFHRRPRRTTPTPAGAAFLAEAELVLQAAARANAAARSAAGRASPARPPLPEPRRSR